MIHVHVCSQTLQISGKIKSYAKTVQSRHFFCAMLKVWYKVWKETRKTPQANEIMKMSCLRWDMYMYVMYSLIVHVT